jgi:hypothetical protein
MEADNLLWLKTWFSKGSYYVIFALVLTWALTLLKTFPLSTTKFLTALRLHKSAIILTFFISIINVLSVPPTYRVLSDETNLLSVAKTMTFEKRVDNVTQGKWYYGMFWPIERSIEKRPFLFPFFVHITHEVLGYTPANVFVFNFLVFWALLFLVYYIIQGHLARLWGYAGVIMLAAQPMVALFASSGGCELFNVVFLILSFLALRYFLKAPTRDSFTLLVMTLLMLVNIRYESIVFFIVPMGILCLGRYIRWSYLTNNIILWCSPLFLLPWLAQRVIMSTLPDVNLVGRSWVDSFRWEYAAYNITPFVKYIFDVGGTLGYAGLINIVGGLTLIYFAYKFFVTRKYVENRQSQFLFVIPVAAFLLWFVVVISYQGGINDHPTNGRLYLPLLVLLSVLPIALLASFSRKDARQGLFGLIAAIMVFIYYHPVAMEDRLTNQLFIMREERFVREFLQKQDKNLLTISARPGQLSVYNYGALSFNTANQQKNILAQESKNRLYDAIYAIQAISYKTKKPLKDYALDPSFKLTPVATLQMTADYFFQISRVDF